MAVAAVTGAVASLAAGGLSYYSNMEQSVNAKALADYNASIQTAVSKRQAEINEALYQSQMNLSKTYDNQATSTMLEAKEEMRRKREEKLRFMATQNAAFAAGGVITEGSPLTDLSDTAKQYEISQNDIFRTADQKSRELEEQGDVARYNATMQNEVNKMNSSAMLANIKSSKAAAYATAAGYTSSGYGSLLSSATSAGTSLSNVNFNNSLNPSLWTIRRA